MMLGFHHIDADELRRTTSELLERVQRLESEQGQLRARLEGDRQLRLLTANITSAALVAPEIGAAIERFAQAMRAPLPRGRAGGLARARDAWRYVDGTLMPESERHDAYRQEYERYAAVGRARAAGARRATDGTFLSSSLR
ncbi:MAG: hypothetical protein ABSD31_02630 [Candidatus Binataceae bacterium]|jgi:hypothetical protein